MQQTFHERPTSVCTCDIAVPVCISDWVNVCLFASVCAGMFTCVCVKQPEGSLCACISLKRRMNRADSLGRRGSSQSFIWTEMILALRFGELTQEQCQPFLLLLLLPILSPFFVLSMSLSCFLSLPLRILSSSHFIYPVYFYLWLATSLQIWEKWYTGFTTSLVTFKTSSQLCFCLVCSAICCFNDSVFLNSRLGLFEASERERERKHKGDNWLNLDTTQVLQLT